jgi:2-haloacid dehalogenase
MAFDRRDFLELFTAGTVAGVLASPASAEPAAMGPIEAVAFDAFPVFDPRPAAALAERLFPGKGEALVAAWRTRQFEYQWLRTMSGRFADFVETAEAGLVFAAKLQRLELTPEKRSALLQSQLALEPWPDAPGALRALKAAGLRLAFLSNMTAGMLEDGIRNGKLEGLFEHVLSTDRVRAHKPDPRAYRMGVEAFGLAPERILFVTFAGWDTAGARWFGYPTFWVNRLGVPPEELGVAAHGSGRGLADLEAFVKARNA